MNGGVKESGPGQPKSARDGRSRRWDQHRARRRQEFVAAAIEAITADGPDVHVEQIARGAGVSRPVLYRHFKDRADLDQAIALRAGELLLADLAPALTPTGSPATAIRHIVDTYLHWVEARPELCRFVRLHAAAGQSATGEVRAIVGARASTLLAGYFRYYGVESAVIEHLAYGVVGLIDAAIDRWLDPETPPVDADRLAERITAAAWRVIEGELRAHGVEVDPDEPLPDLSAVPTRSA